MGSQHRALGLILLLATVTLVWDRGPAAAEPSHAPANVPPSQSLADRHPKLDSQLVALAQAERERGGAAAVEEARARGLRVPDQRVQVVIESSRADRSEARQVVALAGGQTQAEYANLVQALLPIAALETV